MRSDIRSLYPSIYRGVLETDILADIEDLQFNNWFSEMDDARNNQFILTADIRGIEAFERVYEIQANPSEEDIEFRRRRVLAKMLMRIPFTWRFLLQYLRQVDEGYTAALYHDEYLVIIQGRSFSPATRAMLFDALRQIVPANMGLGFEQTAETLTCAIKIGGVTKATYEQTSPPRTKALKKDIRATAALSTYQKS